jgi:hypothetical protein
MNTIESYPQSSEVASRLANGTPRRRNGLWAGSGAALGLVAALALTGGWLMTRHGNASAAPPPPMPLPAVTVSAPLQRAVGQFAGFLGQFAAVNRVELRAQVGGTLSEIHFRDGGIVHQGDLLFLIDPRPYAIKVAEQEAEIQSAEAKLAFLVANSGAHSSSRRPISEPPRTSTSATPTNSQPRHPWPRHGRNSPTPNSISSTPMSPRLSPDVSANIRSRSEVSSPAAVAARAGPPCSRPWSPSIRSISTSI